MFSFPLKFVSSSFLVIIYNLFNYNPSPQISFNVFHIYLLFMAHYSGLTNVPGSLSQEETIPHSQRLTARSSSYQVSFENSNKPGMVTPAFRSSTGRRNRQIYVRLRLTRSLREFWAIHGHIVRLLSQENNNL